MATSAAFASSQLMCVPEIGVGSESPRKTVTVRKNLWYFYLLVLLSLSHAFPRALADGYFLGLGFFSTGKCTVICT